MVTVQDSLWELAFKDLEPDLSRALQSHVVASQSNPQELALKANDTARSIQDEKSATKTAKLRSGFEATIKYVLLAKDYVSAAAEASPYASLAWSGVCLILPLVTKPTEENEAAIQGLEVISKLFIVYRWKERTYRKGSSAEDFDLAARELYSSMLEYEARLLIHMHDRGGRRWVSDVVHAGKWTALQEKIERLDEDCNAVTDAMSKEFAENWRHEEKDWQQQLLAQPRLEKEKENIRLLYSLYEEGKNTNPGRAPKTGDWFLAHPYFLAWREATCSKLLWLSADAGCGKSVLSKYLVDRKAEALSVRNEPPLFCYFFFKDDDSSAERSDGCVALRALLHQIFLQRPRLYRNNAEHSFENKGSLFLKDLDSVWGIFEACITDTNESEAICVLDALDECHSLHRRKIIAKIVNLQKRLSSQKSRQAVKFFLTSRPFWEVERDLKGITDIDPRVRIQAQHETLSIQKEIDYVIDVRVDELTEARDLDGASSEALRKRLRENVNRTYLWLYLVLDVLSNELNLTSRSIARTLSNIPLQVGEAYNKMLQRSPQPETARKLLHLVLAATRPLTTNELAVAMAVAEESYTREDIADEILWSESAARTQIQNMCGLFLTVLDNKVYLIHQTAKDFLLRSRLKMPPSPPDSPHIHWRESFDLKESHLILAKACIYFLLLKDFSDTARRPGSWAIANTREYALYDYAALNWGTHLNLAGSLAVVDAPLLHAVTSKLYVSPYQQRWAGIYTNFLASDLAHIVPADGVGILWAAHLGHLPVLQHLLQTSDAVDMRDKNERTALMFAADAGELTIVQVLLDKGADASLSDRLNQTSLTFAVQSGVDAVVTALVQAGSPKDTIDAFSRTPLSYVDVTLDDEGGQLKTQLVLGSGPPNVPQVAPKSQTSLVEPEEQGNELAEIEKQVRLYFKTRLDKGFWLATDRDSHLSRRDASHPTSLSELVDEMGAALDATMLTGDNSLKRARQHLLRTIGFVTDVVATEPPFAVLHILRIIARCSHEGWSHIRELVCELLFQEANRSLEDGSPARQLFTSLKKHAGSPDKALNTQLTLTCIQSISSAVGAFSDHLGPHHMQTVYAENARLLTQTRLFGPGSSMSEARAFLSGIIKDIGPASPQALTVMVTLSEMQCASKDWEAARRLGQEIINRSQQLLSSRSKETRRYMRFLCSGYHTLAEGLSNQGRIAAAETNFRLAVQKAEAGLGPGHNLTKYHKETLKAWLLSQGRPGAEE